MPYGLTNEQLATIKTIIASYPEIQKVILFGSCAIDSDQATADINLAISGDNLPADLSTKLKAQLKQETNIAVDIIDYEQITSKKLLQYIDDCGVVVFQKEKSEWVNVKISDFCDICRGGSPRPIQSFIQSYGTPWVKIADAKKNPRYIYETNEFIKPEGETNSRVVNPGDFILSNSATPGLPRFMKIRACIHDGWLLFRNFKDNIHLIFLYYLLIYEREALLVQGNGSIFTNLKTDILKNHKITLPPLPEQQAIAEVLSSLDDKIDLLHRQNKTLEDMAQTLFRQWFIEEAQDDWEEKPLSSIADFLNGLACQKYSAKNNIDKLPVLKIKQLRNGISDDCDWCTTDVKQKYIVNKGDLIFSWSASLLVKIWDGDKCILNQHLFKVTSESFPKWFIYFWCKYHLDEFIGISSSHATTMGHIKRGDLDTAICNIPTKNELEKYDRAICPIMSKFEYNSKNIRQLENLRETLLPKLISGEVSVKY